ncbi:MaoC/PaaZ C-terminal domain-containing protein [Acinetobacter ursingii]|uniref:MaoC/PaaZ C-terminal domain-containing protein n=1 Tax=Acinetobacter ursingii TaxID=108980 RepID=UPI0005C966EE|nr:MaoC/PaaZ C-terminal domain-containing protein [Acinetobacter ursingii]
MNNFEAWIGKKEVYHDVCNDKPIGMMQALLNQYGQPIDELPLLFHWLYFLPVVNQSELAEDGHPHKGSFLPPIPFPKRMWAGGRLKFHSPIRVNQQLRRESEILNVEFKQGRSGDLYFVTVQHSIFADDVLAIVEEHDIVYREATSNLQNKSSTQASEKPKAPEKSELPAKNYSYKKSYPVTTTTLFRYSALTFNGHKIHYDRSYCTQVEGYPGLVVHGPLLATLLLHFMTQEYPDKQVKSFEFRAVKPVFDFNEFYVCGDIQKQDGELWIEHVDGQTAMQAKVSFK